MSRYTLGVDTSNYATSLAVFDTAGEVVCAKKRFLPVKAGQLGLRQSDALFHHTAALPEMLQELAQELLPECPKEELPITRNKNDEEEKLPVYIDFSHMISLFNIFKRNESAHINHLNPIISDI